MDRFTDSENILINTAKFEDALELYSALKADAAERRGYLKGIQIFGSRELVPAFELQFEIQMDSEVDRSGRFFSDFFYSNFDNEPDVLRNFSIYRGFAEGLGVSFNIEWPVARLPLVKGEFAAYLARVEDYASLIKARPFGDFVSFSNPIFPSFQSPDDFGYFLSARLDREFNILAPEDYRLYGNQVGYYPVQTDVLGDYTRENLAAENAAGIMEFIISSHGQWNNIDQVIFESSDADSEKRVSFLNIDNINDVLSANYYNLNLWTCNNGYRLSSGNLVHEAMANGLCISAFAATTILSNNGTNNRAALAEMQENNMF